MQLLLSLFAFLAVGQAYAAEPSPETKTVAAEADILQSKSPESPVKLSLDYKSDVVKGLKGGISNEAIVLGSVNVGASLDWERIAAIKGLSMRVQGCAVFGRAPSERIGDFQGVDNISASHSIRLYQAWLQKNFWDDRLSVLAGLHDLNSEFYVTDSSGMYLNNAFGIGPELARSGRTGPSLWPTTSLAARVRASPSDLVQVSVAAYDAVPGDPDHPDQSTAILNDLEGGLGIAEVALLPKINGLGGKYSIGGWAYHRGQNDISGVDENGVPIKVRNVGIYFLLDQRLYAPDPRAPAGLSAFLRGGWAASNVNLVEYTAQSGVSYTGLIPRREQDQLALGLAVARVGSSYRNTVLAKGDELGWHELTLELTYKVFIKSWIQIQPDFQWISTPNMNSNASDAYVGAGRIALVF